MKKGKVKADGGEIARRRLMLAGIERLHYASAVLLHVQQAVLALNSADPMDSTTMTWEEVEEELGDVLWDLERAGLWFACGEGQPPLDALADALAVVP